MGNMSMKPESLTDTHQHITFHWVDCCCDQALGTYSSETCGCPRLFTLYKTPTLLKLLKPPPNVPRRGQINVESPSKAHFTGFVYAKSRTLNGYCWIVTISRVNELQKVAKRTMQLQCPCCSHSKVEKLFFQILSVSYQDNAWEVKHCVMWSVHTFWITL